MVQYLVQYLHGTVFSYICDHFIKAIHNNHIHMHNNLNILETPLLQVPYSGYY